MHDPAATAAPSSPPSLWSADTALFRAAPVPAVVVDAATHQLHDANNALCSLTGSSRDALIGRRVDEALAVTSDPSLGALLRRPWPAGPVAGTILDHSGAALSVELFAARLPDSAAAYLQIVDVSHHRDRHDELERHAHLDDLTGLLNRRGFTAAAGQLLEVARRDRRAVTLLFIDVDGLKRINDEHGHAAGDRAIHEAGTILRRVFRDADALGRLGGDEFCVLALTNRPESTSELRDRLVEAVDRHATSRRDPYVLRVTVGAVHCADVEDATLEDLVHAADRAMYRQRTARIARTDQPTAPQL